jgi:hypothetical protein
VRRLGHLGQVSDGELRDTELFGDLLLWNATRDLVAGVCVIFPCDHRSANIKKLFTFRHSEMTSFPASLMKTALDERHSSGWDAVVAATWERRFIERQFEVSTAKM